MARIRPSTYSPEKAFFKKFPFLEKYIAWENVDFPRVCRVTSEFLNETASRNETPVIFYYFSIGRLSAGHSDVGDTRIRLLDPSLLNVKIKLI